MDKVKIRCYKQLGNFPPDIFNYRIYYLVYEGWSHFSLATCVNCGELFVINWENPATKGLTTIEIAASSTCPTCKVVLKESIREYPKVVKLPNGKLGSFIPSTFIRPDDESLVREFFELALK